MSTPAFTVEIGNYALNVINPEPGINSEGRFISGRPNPTRITWTKENSIKVHEIPSPAFKTSRTAKRTLWNLDLEFVILTKSDLDEINTKIEQVGPFMVRTAFKSISMYIKSATITSEAAFDDYRQVCNMKLIECFD